MLKKLLKQKELDEAKKALLECRENQEKMHTRESELAEAIEEANTEEEKALVEEAVEKYEEEKQELDEKIQGLEEKVASIEKELSELEERSNEAVKGEEELRHSEKEAVMDERKYFGGMHRDAVMQLVKREDVKKFLGTIRAMGMEKRGVNNADFRVPSVLLGVLRDNINKYSKLMPLVYTRSVKGEGRMILPGAIPEAVWTEACANLNELALRFYEVEFDAYKVGGFIPVCNATLKDADDVNLYDEIMRMLAQAIGLAVDKAILYGTGAKMPLGIVTRLNQVSEPDGYSKRAVKWENLKDKNVKSLANVSMTAPSEVKASHFAEFMTAAGALRGEFSNGKLFWAMNQPTYLALATYFLNFNAAGSLVAGDMSIMPVIGGDVVILPFMPDGQIVGGYGDLYALVEREGVSLRVSEHVQFIQDNTVFAGTARYDGAPVVPEAFVVLNLQGASPEAPEFAKDSANTPFI